MRIVHIAIVGVVLGAGSPMLAQPAGDGALAKAEAILEDLREGKTANILKAFDAKMAQAIPEAKLQSVWPSVIAEFGAFKSITERRQGEHRGRQTVELILAFEKETIVLRTVFDGDGKVGGLVFRPLSLAVLPASK